MFYIVIILHRMYIYAYPVLEPKPIEYGDEYTPQAVHGHYYARPPTQYFYENGSVGGESH